VFECSGLDFDVEVPEDCLETACGMVVDIHGLSMDAQIQDANTGLRALGRDHGYIVVQPNGQQGLLGLQWEPADDAKVFDFMQRVAAAWNVDDRRWHVTGFSQGGLMSWRLLCEHADALASLAPAGGCGTSAANGCPFVGADVPSDPVDVLYLHGVQDALVSFNCFAPKRDAVISHYELAEGEPVSSDDDYRWIRYAGTAATFETIDHDYQASSPILAGHCIPGSQDDGGAPGQLMSYGCVGPNAVSWGETVMQFFIDHPRD
jgi:poly(3-hydroxybutyrate) depolymerase